MKVVKVRLTDSRFLSTFEFAKVALRSFTFSCLLRLDTISVALEIMVDGWVALSR